MNILLVDDHVLIRDALRGVFEELTPEARLIEAADCRSALRIGEQESELHLAVLDLNLPDGDGLDLLALLRNRHPLTAAVVLSAASERAIVLRALDNGAAGFIPKSANRPVMVHALRLVLAGGTYIPSEALARANTSGPAGPPTNKPTPKQLGLTDRQLEVLALMMQGKSNKWICRSLDLAEPTVKHHVTSILKALNVSNRTEAVVAVTAFGWKLPEVS
jgi:DNA-binding NarL/FixJ family response regulator